MREARLMEMEERLRERELFEEKEADRKRIEEEELDFKAMMSRFKL